MLMHFGSCFFILPPYFLAESNGFSNCADLYAVLKFTCTAKQPLNVPDIFNGKKMSKERRPLRRDAICLALTEVPYG